MKHHPGTFFVQCQWCGRRRGALPGGVLVCTECDFRHDMASVIPNEGQLKDVPVDWRIWRVPPV